jgi:hypothetical protein
MVWLPAARHACAPSTVLKMAKPNPRERPVPRSVMMRASCTSPNAAASAASRLAGVVLHGRERTNTVRDAGSALTAAYTASYTLTFSAALHMAVAAEGAGRGVICGSSGAACLVHGRPKKRLMQAQQRVNSR